MSDFEDTSKELEVTDNVDQYDVAPEVQETPDTPEVETDEPKSLHDVVRKAYEKTTGAKEPPAPEPVKAELSKEVDPITGREIEPIRAPASMTPMLREKWNAVPREFQKYWIDRERDIQTRLNDTVDERKLAKQFNEVAAPYEAMFRQHGTNAVAHTKELLNLDYQLRTGSPAQKAQLLHSMIMHFQPDVRVLAELAAGQPMPQSQAQQAPNVQDLVRQELEAREEKQVMDNVNREIAAFSADPQNEFLNELRPLMQKAIDGSWVTGNTMPELLRNAYDFAAKHHPEVAQVLASRAAQTPVNQVAQTTKPIQSVKPSLASGGRGGQSMPRPKSRREAVELAYNKHAGK